MRHLLVLFGSTMVKKVCTLQVEHQLISVWVAATRGGPAGFAVSPPSRAASSAALFALRKLSKQCLKLGGGVLQMPGEAEITVSEWACHRPSDSKQQLAS